MSTRRSRRQRRDGRSWSADPECDDRGLLRGGAPHPVSGLILVDGTHPLAPLDESGTAEPPGRGCLTRAPSLLGKPTATPPRPGAQTALATDEVNDRLTTDFTAPRCPTGCAISGNRIPVRHRSAHTGTALPPNRPRPATQVTVFATTAGHPARTLTRDTGLAGAIDEVARRRRHSSPSAEPARTATDRVLLSPTHADLPAPAPPPAAPLLTL